MNYFGQILGCGLTFVYFHCPDRWMIYFLYELFIKNNSTKNFYRSERSLKLRSSTVRFLVHFSFSLVVLRTAGERKTIVILPL
jgi:hypothetical protein